MDEAMMDDKIMMTIKDLKMDNVADAKMIEAIKKIVTDLNELIQMMEQRGMDEVKIIKTARKMMDLMTKKKMILEMVHMNKI